MADNNQIADFSDYRKFVTATHVFKNTSGAKRFFAYVGPNGKELEAGPETDLVDGEVYIHQDSFVHPTGLLANQALNRDLAAGNIKYGNKGVTIYRVKGLTQTTAQTVAMAQPGRVVGAWYAATAGSATGNITIVNTTQSNASVVAATETTLSTATTDKVKQLTIVATAASGRDVKAGDVITCTPGATGGAGTTGDVFIAVAHHSE
jgi:hypothetical protein